MPFCKGLAGRVSALFLCYAAVIINLRPVDFRGNICVHMCFLQKVSLVFMWFSEVNDCSLENSFSCRGFKEISISRRIWLVKAPAQLSLKSSSFFIPNGHLPTQLCYSESMWSFKLVQSKLKIHNVVYKFSLLYVVGTEVCDFSLGKKIKIDLEFILNHIALQL